MKNESEQKIWDSLQYAKKETEINCENKTDTKI